jgi:UDP-N-acetylmuramyl pentapeptide synthase
VTLREIMTEMEGAAALGDSGVDVTGLALDSRQVRRGDLFFALEGLTRDGRAFVDAAFAAGAAGAAAPRARSARCSRSRTRGSRWRRPRIASSATPRARSPWPA